MNTSLLDHPLKVTLVGLDERAQTRLEMFLRGRAQDICVLVGEHEAEAAIVDLDGFGGERLWQAFRSRFYGPALIMSVAEKHMPDALWVRKPLDAAEFLDALKSVQQRLQTGNPLCEAGSAATLTVAASPAPAETSAQPQPSPQPSPPAVVERRLVDRAPRDKMPDPARDGSEGASRAAGLVWDERQIHAYCGAIDAAAYVQPSRRAEVLYAPERYFQGLLPQVRQLAEKHAMPVRLDIMGYTMFYLPESRKVLVGIRENILRPLCVMPLPQPSSGKMRVVHENELPPLTPDDPKLHRFEKLLWLMALWASRGRVPEGTNLDAPVSLLRWPNFTRILMTPNAMQIAALWHTQPTSLLQTAKRLGIPHRQIFALFSACQALGLVQVIDTGSTVVPIKDALAADAISAERRGILGNLLRKLKITH